MLNRFPKLPQTLPVYAVIVFITYGWVLVKFFWNLPAWMFFLSAGEIAGILWYSLAHTFLESLFMIGVLIFAAALLPSGWLAQKFSVVGTIVSLTLFIFIAVYLYFVPEKDSLKNIFWAVGAFLTAILISYVALRVERIGRIIFLGADRFVVFLYIQIPITIIALIAIMARNFF